MKINEQNTANEKKTTASANTDSIIVNEPLTDALSSSLTLICNQSNKEIKNMKLILAIVNNDDSVLASSALT